jgi:predicted  nucleic acid-binding Zn-ribbon protein
MGHVGMPNEQVLAYEVSRLRRRIQELEAELADARALHDAPPEHAAASSAELDLELHRIAEAGSPVPA